MSGRFDRSVAWATSQAELYFLNDQVVIGVDADFACDLHSFYYYLPGGHLCFSKQSAGRGKRISSAGSDCHDTVIGFEHLAPSGNHQRGLVVSDQQQGLEMAKVLVCSPFFPQLDGSTLELPVVLL